MGIKDRAEGLGEGLQLVAIYQRNRAATIAVVIIKILFAVGVKIGLAVGKNIPRKDGISHAVPKDFRRRNDELIGDAPQLPSHLHTTRQTGIQNQEIEVVRNGLREVRQLNPFLPCSDPLLTNRGRLLVLGVTRWQPATSVRRNNHPIPARRISLADLVHHPRQRLRRGADRHVRIGLEGVADGLPVLAPVDAHQHRRIGRGVVPG